MRRRGRRWSGSPTSPGSARTDPALALAMAVFMFSMAGIPPLVGLLRQALRLPRRGAERPVDAGGDRRADQRGRRLLLHPHHQGDVFRRGRQPAFDPRAARRCPSWRRAAACSRRCSSCSRHRSSARRRRRRRCCSGEPAPAAGRLAAADSTTPRRPPPTLPRRVRLHGEPDGLAVLARRQTAGRGSRGRSWVSPAGNLYLSVLLRPRGRGARRRRNGRCWPAVALAEALAPSCRTRRRWR